MMMTTRRRQQRQQIARGGAGSSRSSNNNNTKKPSSSSMLSSSSLLSPLCSVRTFFIIGLIGFFILQIITFVILDGLTSSSTTATTGRNMMESSTKSKQLMTMMTSGKKNMDNDEDDLHRKHQQEHNEDVDDIDDEIIENENDEIVEKPILIIGGSDGSGTRAIVEMLRELGTVIVSDDPQTFDVHASVLHNGWPGLIQRVYTSTSTTSSSSSSSSSSSDGTIFSSSSSKSNNNNTSSSVLQNNYNWPPQHNNDEIDEIEIEKNIANVEGEIITLKQWWDSKYDIAKPIHQQEYNYRQTLDKKNSTSTGVLLSSPIATTLSMNHGRRHTTFPAVAQNVKYAIKAPVSMLVLPVIVSSFQKLKLLAEAKPKQAQKQNRKQAKQPLIKFLHVIRDGRDVALSDNQSPVLKFYNITYPNENDNAARRKLLQFTNEIMTAAADQIIQNQKHNDTTGEEDGQQQQLDNNNIIIYAKAIQLWNDWNSMVYNYWATKKKSNPIQHGAVNAVDYLFIKIEDLLIAGSKERYNAIVKMSNFVNSTLSIEELCCLCRKDTQDYGKSSKIKIVVNVNNNSGNKKLQNNKSENDNHEDDDNNIIARWEMQLRDKQKRELQQKQQQQQQHIPPANTDQQQEHQRRRRLMMTEEDPIISEDDFITDYNNWKIVADKVLTKKKKNTEGIKMYVMDGLIRHGEELYAQRQRQRQRQSIIIEQQVDHDNENEKVIHNFIIEKLKMKLQQMRMEIHNRMASNKSNNNNSNLNQRPSDPTIKKRYGKWQSILKTNTILSDFFHREGAEGLKLFGYDIAAPSSSAGDDKEEEEEEEHGGGDGTGDICEVSIACPE